MQGRDEKTHYPYRTFEHKTLTKNVVKYFLNQTGQSNGK